MITKEKVVNILYDGLKNEIFNIISKNKKYSICQDEINRILSKVEKLDNIEKYIHIQNEEFFKLGLEFGIDICFKSANDVFK